MPGIGCNTPSDEAPTVSKEVLTITTNISLFKIVRAKNEGDVAMIELAAYNWT